MGLSLATYQISLIFQKQPSCKASYPAMACLYSYVGIAQLGIAKCLLSSFCICIRNCAS